MDWPPSLLLSSHADLWSVDATLAGVDADALGTLSWERAFDLEEAAERGEHVNTSEDRAVGHSWLRAPGRAPTVALATEVQEGIERTLSLAEDVRDGRIRDDADQRFTDVLHLGVGGSLLGPQLLVDALSEDVDGHARGLRVHFLDNIDPDGMRRALGRLGDRLSTTLVVVVSKSGGTTETMAMLTLVQRVLTSRGLHPPSRMVAITGSDSTLAARASAESWLGVLPLWVWVGGRFGTTSPAGLFTATLAGLDTASLLAGAASMDDWTRRRDPLRNPAALLAGSWHLLGGGVGDRALVTLPYVDRLQRFGRWLQQVAMESIGKATDRSGDTVQQGLTVFGTKGSTDQHAYVQQLRDGRDDAIVLFLQTFDDAGDPVALEGGHTAGDTLQGFLMGTRRALRDAGRPSLTLSTERLDEHALGALIALFERAVSLYAGLVDVNAFDQPGVEAGKRGARAFLELAGRVQARLQEGPATVKELAAALDADPLELLWLLSRRRAQGQVEVDGAPDAGPWRQVV